MKYKLITPFKEATGSLVEAVNIREVQTVGDVLFAAREGKKGLEAVYATVARMCGLLLEDVEKMDSRDADAILLHMERLYAPAEPASDPKV